MRVLHLADRLSDRGGAHWHLRGLLERLRVRHELLLAVGRDDEGRGAPCPVERVAGLDCRTRDDDALAALDRLAAAFRPDAVHVHMVVNPAVLEWAAERGALMTVQDHRYSSRCSPSPASAWPRSRGCV